MRQILVMLFILALMGCAAPKEPRYTTSEPSSQSSALDERAKNFYRKIAGESSVIDRTAFFNYYRNRVTELKRDGQVKLRMSKDEMAQQATQQFRLLDLNRDKKITEEELRAALVRRAQERKKIRINPREWNLLDDAFK